MFINIKDIKGLKHIWPISLVVPFKKEDDTCYARVQYSEWEHENIPVDNNEYHRVLKMKHEEDNVLKMDTRTKTAIQTLEV